MRRGDLRRSSLRGARGEHHGGQANTPTLDHRTRDRASVRAEAHRRGFDARRGEPSATLVSGGRLKSVGGRG